MTPIVLILSLFTWDGGSSIRTVEGFTSMEACQTAAEGWVKSMRATLPAHLRNPASATCAIR
ncbi:MAG: hypothetical protein EPO10_17705 [Reyranella sp.]|uniref:hypothetical protein n=1 Tax=Reyranella sp. TaxID=1929291 RepID=UPI001219FC22|nr:hypothetical protein [Reyranella sp.]TAJ97176.1 MAG: hypothetical protein EPO41_04060 [Reyranella sp.]TBR27516.1 MAG: hypothetical protein EPO10_17705 [Reyranella sp.]